jgi:hypothetical protein
MMKLKVRNDQIILESETATELRKAMAIAESGERVEVNAVGCFQATCSHPLDQSQSKVS